jgi:hypothetical protein
LDTNTLIDMPYSINGISVNNISRINGYNMGGQNRINGISVNVCVEYTLTNNNPPFPPSPPIQFDFTDCAGIATFSQVPAGGQDFVCAIVGTVMDPPEGTSSAGSPCG